MDLVTLIGIGISLSMDAFSVSICKGLTTKRFYLNTALICGLWFGFFQALMPVIGYFVGIRFSNLISTFDHWIAFGLLLIIGANMIRESFNDNDDGSDNGSTKFKTMFVLAVATSIDALAVGVTFAFIQVNIWFAVTIIGLITFAFSICGVVIGNFFGARFHKSAGVIGGCILIILGVKILLEHFEIFKL